LADRNRSGAASVFDINNQSGFLDHSRRQVRWKDIQVELNIRRLELVHLNRLTVEEVEEVEKKLIFIDVKPGKAIQWYAADL
jgi:hypothetical protein